MVLNKQKGNMFPFVTHTYNLIRGKCPHKCNYCYVKKIKGYLGSGDGYKVKNLRTERISHGKKIFVGSTFDIFADAVDEQDIRDILMFLWKFENEYFFFTKNPKRYQEFIYYIPDQAHLGVTIESDIKYRGTKAPSPAERLKALKELRKVTDKIIISVEPVMEFTDNFADKIVEINPEFVTVGANTYYSTDLKEPSSERLRFFLGELTSQNVRVLKKENLGRLLYDEEHR